MKDQKILRTFVLLKDVPNFFSPFFSASPEIKGVKVCCRQTNSLTPYIGMCGFFLSVKFATTLIASLLNFSNSIYFSAKAALRPFAKSVNRMCRNTESHPAVNFAGTSRNIHN